MTISHLRSAEEPESLRLVEHPALYQGFERTLESRVESEDLLTEVQRISALRALQALARDPKAFYLGHGPGVGKTRILAVVAKQHLLDHQTPSILWVVPNVSLKKQAMQEMAIFGLPEDACRLTTYAQIRGRDEEDSRGSLLILDEAHMIKNACATSNKVNALQDNFEAVLYSTATAASNVARLSYMKRLQLWGAGTPFDTFQGFTKAMKRWGPAAAEMLALDLKQRGLYTCFKLPLVHLRHFEVSPTLEARRTFDEACKMWTSRTSPDRFSFCQRLTTSLKTHLLLPRWKSDLREGFAVVIVLQGTGAARAEHQSMLRRICARNGVRPPHGLPEDALQVLRTGLLPENVAEISGRPLVMRQTREAGDDEQEQATIGGNNKELIAFRDGRRRVLAMTAAGTLGLNVTSPLPIRMYILELPWTPESLAQQLGRCNRLNSTAPEYFVVSMNTFVEKRVEASLAARSETLGALTCADRTAGALRSLPWGRRLVKMVTLEMTVRLLADSLPADVVRKLVEDTASTSTLARREAWLAKLQHEDLLHGSDAERVASLRSILTADSRLACWLSGGWSPRSHSIFSPTQQALVWQSTLALSHQGLPSPLIRCVLEMAFGSDWAVAKSLKSVPSGKRFLDEKDSTTFLNVCASLPLSEQQRLLQSCEENALRITQKEPRIMSALEYCTGRRVLPCGFSFELSTQRHSDCEKTVVVVVRNTMAKVESPLLFALSSGHVVHISDEILMHPGRTPLARTVKHEAQTKGWIPVDAMSRFRALESKNTRHRIKAASAMSKTLLLRHRNPLLYWDVSMGQVLSVSDANAHGRFVGLLMEGAPFMGSAILDEDAV